MDQPLEISPKRNALVIFFSLTFALTWLSWILAGLAEQGSLPFPFPVTLSELLGAWVPSLLGIALTMWGDGRLAVRLLIRRMLIWRVGLNWYVFVLFWPAVLCLLVSEISMLLGAPVLDFSNPLVKTEYPIPPEAFSIGLLPFLPMVFVIQFLGSSLGEELGWRGYALPRLQSRRSALLASLILGASWGLWSIPRYWTPGADFRYAAFAWFFSGIILNSILYTWIFNNTRGSLLLVVLFHTAQPVTNLFLATPSQPPVEIAITVLLVILVVARFGAEHLTHYPTAVSRGIASRSTI
jgi:membrane protease YdiL (CAAX protease family)